MIVDGPQWILDLLLRPHLINLKNSPLPGLFAYIYSGFYKEYDIPALKKVIGTTMSKLKLTVQNVD